MQRLVARGLFAGQTAREDGLELADIGRPRVPGKRFEDVGFIMIASTPEEFGAFIKTETVKWEKLIRDNAIKVE